MPWTFSMVLANPSLAPLASLRYALGILNAAAWSDDVATDRARLVRTLNSRTGAK